MSIRIAIAGVAGRMGQTLARTAGADVAVVGGSERAGAPQVGQDIGPLVGLPEMGAVISDSPSKAAAQADVWVDFTTPSATLAALDALKGTPVKAAIIGTTGLSPRDETAIAVHARRIAIVKAGNFSLGVNMLLALIEQAAERLGPDWDIEIAETHHRHKVDAPSGTALMMGEAAAKGRSQPLDALRTPPYSGVTGPREPGRIGFAVSRAGGVIGDHEAVFASEEEVLILGHRALNRALFARGALHAAKWAIAQPPGLYSMRDVLAL